MIKQKFLNLVLSLFVVASLLFGGINKVSAQEPAPTVPQGSGQAQDPTLPADPTFTNRVTPAERQAVADSNTSRGLLPGLANPLPVVKNNRRAAAPDPSVVPHYFGPFANYANSPLPKGAIASITLDAGGSGYSATPVVNIYDAYGTGMDAAATATVVGGVITAITVDTAGFDYSAPIVVIDDTTGTGAAATPVLGSLNGGIRKFVDSLPGLGATGVNNLNNFLPVAVPDTDTYGAAFGQYAADYYEIALVEFTQQVHSDLPPTTFRGYVQLETPVLAAKLALANPGYTHVQLFYLDGTPIQYADGSFVYAVDKPRYLGPNIVSTKGRPVRIKFYNFLPTGQGGDLFIPVDETVMGSGEGPKNAAGGDCNRETSPTPCEKYSQNRATLHLHGGLVPWISDGTPHQWITPAGETTKYPKGVSVEYVPDMWFDSNGNTVPAGTLGASNNPGDGAMTFYYNSQQSARLMFYHDHAYGITRLNVYAGEAAGYVITDDVEKDLIDGTNVTGVNPDGFRLPQGPSGVGVARFGLPLVFQDKTFVDANTIAAQDPTWRWGTGAVDPATGRRVPNTGDLWVSSVYMPVQNPWEVVGEANAFGRWQYGPWFWPPTESVVNGPIPNEYYDPGCDPALTWCEPPMRPNMPTPSMGMESYMDTSLVNGAVYPYLEVDPKSYRFRILNAANDRFYNLSMFVAVDAAGVPCDVVTNPTPAVGPSGVACTEVKMVDALTNAAYPTWPADSRAGGAPDPLLSGPDWIQFGNEGGFLPAPVVIPPQPVTWQMNPGLFNVGNVLDHSLLLGNAERADVIVDFSQFAGKTIIVYNDAPTAFPALDPRYDYYTGNPSQMDSGGAPTTQPGYGPNTRTVMQIRVSNTAADPAFDVTALNNVFKHGSPTNANKPGVFETGQPPIVVPQAAYNSAYGKSFPSDASQYVKITDRSMTFTPMGATAPVTISFAEKAIHDEMGASWDNEYGRMSGNLGLELPGTNNLNQNIILYGYASPPVDFLGDSPDLSPDKIGTLQDGTTLWKITHNGVDTHPIHIHLSNAQLINRVGWDGLLLPPDANELGWKETIRVNPLESTIWALRPELPVQPFDIVNSERPIDPTMPEDAPLMGTNGTATFIDPQLNAVSVLNHVINYGWEYVWHCHILSHEEMDMMHSLVFAVTPNAPTGLTATGTAGSVSLTWTDNSVNETGFTVQRSTDGVTWTNIVVPSITKSAKGGTVNYSDTVPLSGTLYLYRVMATNTVGDTAVYANSFGFPTVTKNSDPSNIAANMIGVTSIVRKAGTPNPTQAASVDFTVTFSQDVTGLVDLTGPDFSDFTLTGSTVNSPVITNVAAVSGTVYTVTVSTGTTNGILKLNMDNLALGGPYTSGETYTVEKAAPVVSSINIIVTNPPTNTTVSTGVVYIVTFDKAVTGVDATDFALTPAMPGSSIKTVAGSGATYTVTAVTGAMNNASLRLDLIDNNSIKDLAGIQLGGPLANDGDFTTGQIYMVDNIAPKVLSSVRASAGPVTDAASVDFTVTFSETVTGVGLADFGLNPTVTGASITSVTPVSGTVYTVSVNTGTGSGQLRLIVKDDHSIKDGHLNELGGTLVQTYTSGQSYAVRSLVGVGTYDDTNINWLYEGTWSALAGAGGRYNSTFHYSSIIGNSATIRIDSQRFKLVYTGFTNRGMVDVFVDGVNIATINQYNATLLNQMTWISPVLSAGPHTVSFVLNNTNVSKVIDIDAIQVLAPPYTTPGTITNLTAALGAVSGNVDLAWTAVGNDGMTGTASSYQVRYSTSPITTLALWNTASVVSVGVPTPAASGSSESMTVTGLSLQQKYYFAVRVVNAEAALSALSNSPSSFAKPATLAAGATYDDTNINWIYDGGVWSTLAGAGGRYNSTVHYSQAVGSSATILIDSRRFNLIYTGYTNRGMVDVFVDGVNIATINQYNATLSNQMTWTSPVLSAGPHTVRFVLNNTNVNKVIEVDAIQVLAGPYTTPGTITNLTATLGTATSGSVDLAWTAVGDDGMVGTASSYQVRYSTTPITTQAHWDAASVVSTGVPTPSLPPMSENMTVTGLSLQQKYYFAVRAVNAEAVLGALSNSPSSFARPATLAAGATYDDTNINWIYDGSWSTLSGVTGRYNSTFHYSSTIGNSATILIDGTGFKLVYTGFTNRGIVDVYVDGAILDTINQYNATQFNQMTWTSPVLSAGPHTVRFVVNNTNVSKVIEVDAIQVLP